MIAKYNCTNYDMLDFIVKNNLGNILVAQFHANDLLEYLLRCLSLLYVSSYADQINYLCHHSYFIYILCDIYPCIKEIDKYSILHMQW